MSTPHEAVANAIREQGGGDVASAEDLATAAIEALREEPNVKLRVATFLIDHLGMEDIGDDDVEALIDAVVGPKADS